MGIYLSCHTETVFVQSMASAWQFNVVFDECCLSKLTINMAIFVLQALALKAQMYTKAKVNNIMWNVDSRSISHNKVQCCNCMPCNLCSSLCTIYSCTLSHSSSPCILECSDIHMGFIQDILSSIVYVRSKLKEYINVGYSSC